MLHWNTMETSVLTRTLILLLEYLWLFPLTNTGMCIAQYLRIQQASPQASSGHPKQVQTLWIQMEFLW